MKKIKPKKITSEQLDLIAALVQGRDQNQMKKLYQSLGFERTPVGNLSYSEARRLIGALR